MAMNHEFESHRKSAPQEIVPVEIKRFSDEAREALTKDGYVIYVLNGQSIRAHREAGKKFWSTWHEDRRYADFETQSSISSEVAINPDALFIPKSNRKKISEQQNMIVKFSTDFGKKVKGVGAVMGNAADYVGLAFAHLDATGERLFGEKYGYNWTRTKTPVEGLVVRVGRFDAGYGLHVRRCSPDSGVSYIFAAPLVVPKAA